MGRSCEEPVPRATRLVTPPLSARGRAAARQATETGFSEHVALLACALSRESAIELLDGLCEPLRGKARAQARAAMSWDSATRQARLAVTFGLRSDAGGRLRALMAQAGPALQREILRILPPYHRTLFPDFGGPTVLDEAPCPALSALAERLVREATR